MKQRIDVWEIDWDLVDHVEHIKDILKDMEILFADYPANSAYLAKESVIEIDMEELQ